MKQQVAVESFLAGRRVVIAKFVAHRYKEVQNKAKKVVGIVNLYEVQCAEEGKKQIEDWLPPAPRGGRWKFGNPARCIKCKAKISDPISASIYYLVYDGSLVLDPPRSLAALRSGPI